MLIEQGRWTSEALNNGWNGKLLNPIEESKRVLAHIANLTFILVEWQDKVKEGGPNGCVDGWEV